MKCKKEFKNINKLEDYWNVCFSCLKKMSWYTHCLGNKLKTPICMQHFIKDCEKCKKNNP